MVPSEQVLSSMVWFAFVNIAVGKGFFDKGNGLIRFVCYDLFVLNILDKK